MTAVLYALIMPFTDSTLGEMSYKVRLQGYRIQTFIYTVASMLEANQEVFKCSVLSVDLKISHQGTRA